MKTVPVGDCGSLVDPAGWHFVGPSAQTTASFKIPVAVPSLPALSGVTAVLEAWYLPRAGSFPADLQMTNAVLATIGR